MAYNSYFGRIKFVTYPQSGVGEYTRYNINGFVIEQGHSNDYANASLWHHIKAVAGVGVLIILRVEDRLTPALPHQTVRAVFPHTPF